MLKKLRQRSDTSCSDSAVKMPSTCGAVFNQRSGTACINYAVKGLSSCSVTFTQYTRYREHPICRQCASKACIDITANVAFKYATSLAPTWRRSETPRRAVTAQLNAAVHVALFDSQRGAVFRTSVGILPTCTCRTARLSIWVVTGPITC